MLRLVQLVRFVFGVIVVQFLQQFIWVVVIKRKLIWLQQRIVQFLRVVFGIILLIGQQFVGIVEQWFVQRGFIQQRAAELRDDLRD